MTIGKPGGFASKSPTIKRIMQESKEMLRNPDASFTASPLEDNLYEWHFTLRGPPASPYERGIYHGRIILPTSYPLRPPTFKFLTPTGRFEVNREICLSISGHHEETWQPAWGIRTALCAIRAFMESDAKGQVGGIDCTDAARRRMATESTAWRCPNGCGAGHTLQEIMAEWESTRSGVESAQSSEVPPELKLAYKDELGKSENKSEDTKKEETPARTVPTDSGVTSITNTARAPLSAVVPASSPAPTPAAATATAVNAQAARRVGSQGHTTTALGSQVRQGEDQRNNGVPLWVDNMILAVSFALVVILVKRFLS